MPTPIQFGRPCGGAFVKLLSFVALATAAVIGGAFYFSTTTIHELLTENKALSEAVHNLTDEERIGYAKVLEQTRTEDGQTLTRVKFVQSAAGRPDEIVSEQIFEVLGSVIYFDALIVKFTDAFVKDGKARALFLWRRIYSDSIQPDKGQPIEIPGSAPDRYYEITRSLKIANQAIFWEAVWNLANDPQYLSEYGIRAVFGNAIYIRMEPDRVYLFKVTPTGQIYPEVVRAW